MGGSISGLKAMINKYFNELTKSLPEACFLVSRTGEILSVNPSGEKMLETGNKMLTGKRITDLVAEPDNKVSRYIKICLRNREPVPGALRWRLSEGRTIECRCKGHLILSDTKEDKHLVLLSCEPKEAQGNRFIALNKTLEQLKASYHKLMIQSEVLKNEIIERKRAEEEIKESHERLLTVLNGLDAIVYVADMKTHELLFVNNYIINLFGDILGQPCWKTIQTGQSGPCAFCTNDKLLDAAGNPEGIYHWEFQNTANGRWYDVRDRALIWVDGRIVRLEIATDITERKRVEEEIERSLNEKEVMLKEIHHRVKNNLQVIYSLLDLQAKGVTDKKIHALFLESRNRVNSMALIHETLYCSTDLAHIDFKEYLQSLIAGIVGTYKRHDVIFSVDMEPLAIDVNVGIPCGLIVNELVSNSLKHAFPHGGKGTINAGINKNSEGNYVLFVADNGISLPAEVDIRNTSSLGLQLINVLTKQIHGIIELSRTEGTKFSIIFPGTSKNRGKQNG